MGYESRIFIMDRNENEAPNGEKYAWAEKIAMVNMCKMGYDSGFHELFTEPIDYKIFIDDEHDVDEDCYGEHLKYATVQTVIDWLEKEIGKDDYRRLPVLLGLLKGFQTDRWSELQVVHYGY